MEASIRLSGQCNLLLPPSQPACLPLLFNVAAPAPPYPVSVFFFSSYLFFLSLFHYLPTSFPRASAAISPISCPYLILAIQCTAIGSRITKTWNSRTLDHHISTQSLSTSSTSNKTLSYLLLNDLIISRHTYFLLSTRQAQT